MSTPRTDAITAQSLEGDGGRYMTEDLLIHARELECENTSLRTALKQGRDWGIRSKAFSAEQSTKLAEWIDSGMEGNPPPIPDYYPKA